MKLMLSSEVVNSRRCSDVCSDLLTAEVCYVQPTANIEVCTVAGKPTTVFQWKYVRFSGLKV